MKRKKNCDHLEECLAEDARLDPLFIDPCPKGAAEKCLKYEEWEYALRNDRGTPDEHQE